MWIHKDNDLVDLTVTPVTHTKGMKPSSEVLHTNKKHPFLTVEKGCFLPVGQMKLGMHVVEADGQVGVVSGWKVVPGVKVMYNLEVQQDHTFAIGYGQWIVHNDMACGIHSSLKYDRTKFGPTPDSASRTEVLGKDAECVYCEGATPSTEADHIPSLKERWESGRYDNMTHDQIMADANDPAQMCGACKSHNGSKGSLPIDVGDGGWDPASNNVSMDSKKWT